MYKILGFCFMLMATAGQVFTSQAAVVTISGRQVLVNGSPYLIKGICYNPVPKGSTQRSWNTLTEDLALMQEAGINTLRVYAPIDNVAVLDEIAAAGMMLIVGFGYNDNGNFDILSGTYLNYVATYKNHDAILFWEFGNEYNYHPEWFDNNIINWYNALYEAADETHLEDENHPVATAHGELPDFTARTTCPNIDVWGMNVYRWDNPAEIFNEWEQASTLPMYLSEAGADRYMDTPLNGYDGGENPQAQADATRNILNAVFDRRDICSGVTLFEFNDEWWKAGNPATHDKGGLAPNSGGVPYDGTANEEYWGIVDIDRQKTLAYDEVKAAYTASGLGMEATKETPELRVYPNPASHTLTIHGLGKPGSQLQLMDVLGHELMVPAIQQGAVWVANIQALKRGIYVVAIYNGQERQMARFVKL